MPRRTATDTCGHSSAPGRSSTPSAPVTGPGSSFRPADATRAVPELTGQAEEVGEQPDDGQPHLRAVQSRRGGLEARRGAVRSLKAEALFRVPSREHVLQQLAGDQQSFIGAVTGVSGQPQRMGDVEHVAGVVPVGPEVARIASVARGSSVGEMTVRHG